MKLQKLIRRLMENEHVTVKRSKNTDVEKQVFTFTLSSCDLKNKNI
jgi:hypothetical protein